MPSWTEWVGESVDPGDRGSITIRYGLPERRPGAATLTYGLVSAVALAVGLWFALNEQTLVPTGVVLAIAAGYLLIGYVVRPEPDRHNLGWGGGLFDNPFRWSDDLNRTMLWIMLVLWPGRFVAESLIALVAWPFRRAVRDEPLESADDEALGPELVDTAAARRRP